MARDEYEVDPGGYPFSHYDEYGNPIDTNGQVMLVGPGVGGGGGWYDDTPPPTEAPVPVVPAPTPIDPGAGPATPPVYGGGGGGGTDYGGDNPFGAWGGSFTPPGVQPLPDVPLWDPAQSVPGAPQFTPPGWNQAPAFTHPDFVGPTAEEAMRSPGYQFRLGQGSDRLQNWAAARGTLNDSGTAKALMDYGQEAASQEYSNVWKRDYDRYAMNRGNALDTYNTNYRTQYVDPYTASYQAAKDQFAPQMTQYDALLASGRDLNQARLLGYSTDAANVQHLNDQANRNAWDDYLLGWQDYETRRNLAANFALQS
jgi:hypothetical protein